MQARILGVTLLIGLAFASTSCAAIGMYTVTDLGTLGGPTSAGYSVNEDGQVVGTADLVDGSRHPFLWENGVMYDLGDFGGRSLAQSMSYSLAVKINEFGQITGAADKPSGGHDAFLWENDFMRNLGNMGGFWGYGTWSEGVAINDSGTVVGWSIGKGDEWHAMLWQDGVMYDLGNLGAQNAMAQGINNYGQVVGHGYPGETATGGWTNMHAFLWQDGYMEDLGTMGGEQSDAFDINDLGQVVGWSQSAVGVPYTGFLWQSNGWKNLGTLGGMHSWAYGVNNLTQVVGWALTPDNQRHAFFWENDVMYDLNDFIPNGSGLVLREGQGISDRGQIVGFAEDGLGRRRAFLLTPFPLAPVRDQVFSGLEYTY